MNLFTVQSNKLVVSDATGLTAGWKKATIPNVRNGKWEVTLETKKYLSGTKIINVFFYSIEGAIENRTMYFDLQNGKGLTIPTAISIESGFLKIFDSDNQGSITKLKMNELIACDDFSSVINVGNGYYNLNGLKDNSGQYIGFYIEIIKSYDNDEYDTESDEDETDIF